MRERFNRSLDRLQAVDQVSAVTCCGETVDVVEVFPDLRSQITPDGSSDRDVYRRLGLAWAAMSALGRWVWSSKHLSQETKDEVYKRLVLLALLY